MAWADCKGVRGTAWKSYQPTTVGACGHVHTLTFTHSHMLAHRHSHALVHTVPHTCTLIPACVLMLAHAHTHSHLHTHGHTPAHTFTRVHSHAQPFPTGTALHCTRLPGRGNGPLGVDSLLLKASQNIGLYLSAFC